MRFYNKIHRNNLEKLFQSNKNVGYFKNKSILIIGGTGLIGTYLADYLMHLNVEYDMNIRITVTSRNQAKAEQVFGDYFHSQNFNYIQNDILINNLMIDYRIDFVIHAASNTHPTLYANDPVGTIMTNVVGTKNVLDFCIENKVEKLLLYSSVEIYGTINSSDLILESDMGYIDSNTLRAGYPEAKRVSESLCNAYKEKFGLNFVTARLCRIYGPTVRPDDSKVFSQFLRKTLENDDIILKSEGNQYFSFLHVGDAVTASLILLLSGENGEVYNVASDLSNITLKNLAHKMAKHAESEVVFDFPNKIETKGFSRAFNASLDSGKIHELGWNEYFDLDMGIRDTLKILREI